MSYAPPGLNRRAFLRCAADAWACALGARAFTTLDAQAPPPERWRMVSPALRVGVVVIGANDEYATSLMGIELGIDEATRAGSLLGRTVEVVTRANSLASALTLVRRDRPSAMMCAADADAVVGLARECAIVGTPLFNLVADDDALRNERCSRVTFHVSASDAMRRSALRSAADSSTRADTTIELWDDRLDRFGAAQLNDRFRSRFHRPMDSIAWAGWFAVKVAWEASLRARATEGSAIAEYLERETTQFDGQKGVPLSFRRWDHQLRQPLYAVPASRSSQPVSIPASSTGSPRDELDALGSNEEASSCHWR